MTPDGVCASTICPTCAPMSAMPMGDMLFVSAGQNVLETRAIILATGVSRGKALPGESELRHGSADYTGRLCVIGTELKEDALKALFGI